MPGEGNVIKFHQITMKGRFNVEVKSGLPTFDSNRDKGRLVYSETDSKVYFGTESGWQEFSSDADLTAHTDSNVPNVHGTGTLASQDYDDVSITDGNITVNTLESTGNTTVGGNLNVSGEIDETVV